MSARLWVHFQSLDGEHAHYFDVESINYIQTENIRGEPIVTSVFTNNGEFKVSQDTPLKKLENSGFIKIFRWEGP